MQETKFLRVLSRKEVLALAFGAMVGWSWVVLSADWIQAAGTLGAVLAFLVGGLIMLVIGLTYAELASALPFAGGEHVYSQRALGSLASFICTWSIILGYVSVVTFEAVALPTVLGSFIPGLDKVYLWTVAGWDVYLTWVLVGVVGSLGMTILNIRGVRAASFVQIAVVGIILCVGLAFVLGSISLGDTDNLIPFFEDGFSGITLVLVMVPFMFVGFDTIPQAAEEIDLPFRDIGSVLMLSVFMAVAWYSLIILGVGLMLNPEDYDSTDLAAAEANSIIFGEFGRLAMLTAGLAGIMTSWNAFIVGGSRAIYALARARLLPAVFGELHPLYRTPKNAILLIGLLSMLGPLFGRPVLVWLVDAGGFGIVISYAMVALSFLVLRKREPDLPRPFRVRFGKLIGSAALLLSIGLAILYLPGSPSALLWPNEWAIFIGWCAFGAAMYFMAPKNKADC